MIVTTAPAIALADPTGEEGGACVLEDLNSGAITGFNLQGGFVSLMDDCELMQVARTAGLRASDCRARIVDSSRESGPENF